MNDVSQREFLYAQLRIDTGSWQTLELDLKPRLAAWPGLRIIGQYMNLFGMSNQDLLLLVSLPQRPRAQPSPHLASPQNEAHEILARVLPSHIRCIDALFMQATVRPQHDQPHTRAGVYVFRFFDVANTDVNEVAALSQTAWQTFENSNDYQSEPLALFASTDQSTPQARMLLLTWYDNFTSWERSRRPHPDATANFARRRALSKSVIAYATRLTSAL